MTVNAAAARPAVIPGGRPSLGDTAAVGLSSLSPPETADDWTILVRRLLLVPMAPRLATRQSDLEALTQHWSRALAEAGCQTHELVGIRQALLANRAKTSSRPLAPADAVAAMHRLRRDGQALAALPRGGTRYSQRTRQRRLAALYDHLLERAKHQNDALFAEKRGKLWQARLTQALDQAARRTAEQETLIAGIDAFSNLPEAGAVDTVLLSDGWHFEIKPETLADWRRRLPRLA